MLKTLGQASTALPYRRRRRNIQPKSIRRTGRVPASDYLHKGLESRLYEQAHQDQSGLPAICSVQDENQVNATSVIACGMSLRRSRAHSADFPARAAPGPAPVMSLRTAIATLGFVTVVSSSSTRDAGSPSSLQTCLSRCEGRQVRLYRIEDGGETYSRSRYVVQAAYLLRTIFIRVWNLDYMNKLIKISLGCPPFAAFRTRIR